MKIKFMKLLGMFLVVIMCMFSLVACSESENKQKYEKAYELLENGNYQEAYNLFIELGDYKDAKKEASRFHYALVKTTNKLLFGDEEEVETSTTTYNDKNLPIKTEEVYSDGSVRTSNYIFNDQGQLITINCTEVTGEISYTEYTYNNKGELIKYYFKNESGEDVIEYTYDENGNLKTSKQNNSNETPYDIEYSYDEKNKLKQEKYITQTATGIDIATYDYIYDDNGNLINRTFKDNGKIASELIYTYDKNNNCIQETYSTNKTTRVTDYTYDINNYCIKIEVFVNDLLTSECNITYDENGNIINEIKTDSFGFASHKEYSYEFVYVPYDIAWEELIYNELFLLPN